MRIRLFGAAGEVTGSCTLVETDRARVLVDFGLHQGGPRVEARNRRFPAIRAPELDAVLLTHAHIDHSGRLPLLPDKGFAGPVYATDATVELCGILLRDAAHIQEEHAERTSRWRRRKGRAPASPLYRALDAEKAIGLFRGVAYDEWVDVAPGMRARWVEAGHILGSASIELRVEDGKDVKTIAFSGDVGPGGAPLLRDATPIEGADVVVLESTYGDRDHKSTEGTFDELIDIVAAARAENGKVLIPAFAVGRTQNLIYCIGELRREGRLEDPRVWIDSPMAIATTELYKRHKALFDEEAQEIIEAGRADPDEGSVLDFPGLRMARTPDESKALNPVGDGVIVISASGMCTGGRILHHLKHNLWLPHTHVVFVGFQADGTLGRRLVEGAKLVRVMGEQVAVKAQVHTLGGFSAHAGQSDLARWAKAAIGGRTKAVRVLLNHGENGPREKLRERLKQETGVEAELPEFGEIVEV